MTLPPGAILASGLRQVDAVLSALPPDKHVAMVVATRYEDGAIVTRTGLAVRAGHDWAFYAEAETDWRHASAEIGVRWTR